MPNGGDELIKTIKASLKDKESPLDVNTAVQFILSLQLDAIETANKAEAKRKDAEDKKDAAQKIYNDKTTKMWPAYKANLVLIMLILAGVVGLFFDFITISIG